MAYGKFSILIVDEDSRVSRIVRDRLEKAFPEIRIEIAGSAPKARAICSRFPPSWIIWDGLCREGCPLDDYVASIPEALWAKVVPISAHPEALAAAKGRGALEPLPKAAEGLHAWVEALVPYFRRLLPARRK